MNTTRNIQGAIPERLADWVEREKDKVGSWGKLSSAIAAANPRSDMRISTQGLTDWRDIKSETINPKKLQGIINYLKANYDHEQVQQTLAWFYGQENVDRPDLIKRIDRVVNIEEWLNIADTEVLPALRALIYRVPDLAKQPEGESEVSISEFIQSKIREKGLSLDQGIEEIYDWYPRRAKTSLERLTAIIEGDVEPESDGEIHELINALSQFCEESISIDDLTNSGGRVLRIDEA